MIDPRKAAAVVGGGPAGLMAATVAVKAGLGVDVYDAMPSVGRKFLLAGRGGLNLTRAEEVEPFARKYGPHAAVFQRLLRRFSPDDVKRWAGDLGVDTFLGTSRRVFPAGLGAAPLLRAWVHWLRDQGVGFHTRHRWIGFTGDGGLEMDHGGTVTAAHPDVAVLALGGASRPGTGSDGAWAAALRERGVEVNPFKPSNCGFEVGEGKKVLERWEGRPLKNLGLSCAAGTAAGEITWTRYGVEGGGVYALSAHLRKEIEDRGRATLFLDLKRDLSVAQVRDRLERPRGKASLANHLRKTLRLAGPVVSLLREFASGEDLGDVERLAGKIKKLPVPLTGVRPVEEAISSAGGVAFSEVDEDLMLRKVPGVFIAGEMLDYEAPTGGYLLQAAFSTGHCAGHGAVVYGARTKSAE